MHVPDTQENGLFTPSPQRKIAIQLTNVGLLTQLTLFCVECSNVTTT